MHKYGVPMYLSTYVISPVCKICRKALSRSNFKKITRISHQNKRMNLWAWKKWNELHIELVKTIVFMLWIICLIYTSFAWRSSTLWKTYIHYNSFQFGRFFAISLRFLKSFFFFISSVQWILRDSTRFWIALQYSAK